MSFMDELKQVIIEDYQYTYTENGAKVYSSTGNALIDMNYAVSSMRNMPVAEIIGKFAVCYAENKNLAIKWLFYAGDVREGLGERRLFRICLWYLSEIAPDTVRKILPLIAYYTRFDNLFVLLYGKLKEDVCALIADALEKDEIAMKEGKTVSLLAKWLPSVQSARAESVECLSIILDYLGLKKSEYRKKISALRKYMKVVERQMSDGEWGAIEYATVPSKANLNYGGAFIRHDEERRVKYLASVSEREKKINSKVLFPYEIVHRYLQSTSYGRFSVWLWVKGCSLNDTLEELWKALPDYVGDNDTTLCVADGSGSMYSKIGNTSISALEVANSLAIYFSERLGGQFKDKYITFSKKPQLVDFGGANSLAEKISIAYEYNEVADTNIEAVFDLVLKTAVNCKMKAEDIPANLLVLSDMEFNDCMCDNEGKVNSDAPLFDVIAKKYADAGIKMPRLIFWNLNSRTLGVPIRKNENGLVFVSGFSPAVCKMVLTKELDPLKCMLEILNSERYEKVDNALID